MNADQDKLIRDEVGLSPICVHPRSSAAQSLPLPRVGPIAIRTATMTDLPFLDALQKQHNKALGFFPRAQMEGYVRNGWVLIAEDAATKQPLGYCASRDRYLKRDELGVIYQLCVTTGFQRGLVGASLIKAVFERSAYGCRLYCCWCAQDLDANHFWESLGFVPIAFRGGSGTKKRVHIFWQRRVREGDVTTPWWFPAKTDQGAMREDRLVLPIPPGLGWRDEMPVLIGRGDTCVARGEGETSLVPTRGRSRRVKQPEVGSKGGPLAPTVSPRARAQFGRPGATMPIVEQSKPAAEPKPAGTERSRSAKPPRQKERVDPAILAKARELRDRYLERLNESPNALAAPAARYDVSRSLALPDAPRALPNAA